MPKVLSSQPLPLDRTSTCVARSFQFVDSAVLFVPLSALTKNALTFSDWQESQWVPFTQVFFELVGHVVDASRGTCFLEEIHAKPDRPGGTSSTVHGYAYRLFLTDDTGASLNDLARNIVMYNNTRRMQAKQGDIEGLRHVEWLKSPKRHTPDERWKLISGYQEWSHLVEYCVGVHAQTADAVDHIAQVAFDPEAAFVNHIEAIDLNFSSYDQLGDGLTRQVTWPDVRYVYRLERDLCRTIRLMRTILPHIQANLAMVNYKRESLLPLVIDINNRELTSKDVRKRLSSHDNLDRFGSLSQSSSQERRFFKKARIGSRHAAMALSELMEAVDRSGTAESKTESEWEIQKKRYSPLVSKNNLYVSDRKVAARFFDDRSHIFWRLCEPLVSPSTEESMRVSTQNWSNRLIHLMTQEIQMNEFSERLCSGKLRSECERHIDRAIESSKLFEVDKFKNWIMRLDGVQISKNVYEKGIFAAWGDRFLATMEAAHGVNHTHFYIYDLAIGSNGSWDLRRRQKVNYLAVSTEGAKSKSFSMSVLFGMCIDKTALKITWLTPASLATETEPDNNGFSHAIFDGFLWFFDEVPKAVLQSSDGTSNGETAQRVKEVLSEQEMSVVTVFINPETGTRTKLTFRAKHNFVMYGNANIELDILDHPTLRRFKANAFSEGTPEGRTISQRQFEGMMSRGSKNAQKSDFTCEFQFLQACHSMIGRLICASVISEVSFDLVAVVMPVLIKSLLGDKQNAPGFREPDSSVVVRLENYCRMLCISRVVFEEFLHPARGKDLLTISDFVALEKHLFVTVEDLIGALGHELDEFMPPLESAVSTALKSHVNTLVMRDEPYRHKFDKKFAPASGAKETEPDCERDANYMRFHARRLASSIAKLIPQMMDGYKPSISAVNMVFKKFVDTMKGTRGGYKFHKKGGMVVLDKHVPQTEVDLFKFEQFPGFGRGMYLDVHVSFFEFLVADSDFEEQFNTTYTKDVAMINWKAEYERRNESLDECVSHYSGILKTSLSRQHAMFRMGIQRGLQGHNYPLDFDVDWKKHAESVTLDQGSADLRQQQVLPSDSAENEDTATNLTSSFGASNSQKGSDSEEERRLEPETVCLNIFGPLQKERLLDAFQLDESAAALKLAKHWSDELENFVKKPGQTWDVPGSYRQFFVDLPNSVKGNRDDALSRCHSKMESDLRDNFTYLHAIDAIVLIQSEKFRRSLEEAVASKFKKPAINTRVEFPRFEQKVKNVNDHIKQVLDTHINRVFNKKFQFAHNCHMGPSHTSRVEFARVKFGPSHPAEAVSDPTQSFQVDMSPTTCHTLDEYSKQKYRDPRAIGGRFAVECSLDTFAMAIHNRNLHRTALPVTRAQIDKLSQVSGTAKPADAPRKRHRIEVNGETGQESRNDDASYFFGYDTDFVNPDTTFEPTKSLVEKIERILQDPPRLSDNSIDNDHLATSNPLRPISGSDGAEFSADPYKKLRGDLDFDLDDYRIEQKNGSFCYHWDLPNFKNDLPAKNLGYSEWSKDDAVLAMQYKMVCTHPVVKQHYLRSWSDFRGRLSRNRSALVESSPVSFQAQNNAASDFVQDATDAMHYWTINSQSQHDREEEEDEEEREERRCRALGVFDDSDEEDDRVDDLMGNSDDEEGDSVFSDDGADLDDFIVDADDEVDGSSESGDRSGGDVDMSDSESDHEVGSDEEVSMDNID